MHIARNFVATPNELTLCNIEHDRRLARDEYCELLALRLGRQTGFSQKPVCQIKGCARLADSQMHSLRIQPRDPITEP